MGGGRWVSTCVWNCLQLGVHPYQQEARGVPGEGPELGLVPGCGGAWPGPLRSASRSPHRDQTAGPGNGSVPAQQGPGRGLSPPPSPRPPTHIGQPADDSLGAPFLGGQAQRLWFRLLCPLVEHPEECALEGGGGRGWGSCREPILLTPHHSPIQRQPHSLTLPPHGLLLSSLFFTSS